MARRGRRTRSANNNSERLVGWLVSYAEDEKGKAHEIRSGRTIIGSQSSGARIITLSESSISDTHLAMRATPKHKLFVQDIFSESGSYIQRSADNKEKEIQGPTELAHGDWIRVGDQKRFQVCLIDGPTV